MMPLRMPMEESFFLPEERNGYVVSAEMKKVWAVELDLLNEFSRVCSAHGLKWFVHAGTMLGAIRHQGFIPWDDDIDVIMPRDDYERLCELGPGEFSHPYFFQNDDTDRFFARPFSRLRNSETTAIFANDRSYRYPFNQGIFIDIFPIDHVPADPQERSGFYKDLNRLGNRAWQWRNMIHFYRPKRGKGVVKRMVYGLKHFYYKYFFKGDYRYYLEKHHEMITKYDSIETGWVGESVIYPLGRHLWRSEWFQDAVNVPFEMLQVPVPVCYEECLSASFGSDWRTPRHVPTMHGDTFFDSEKPYTFHLNQ